MNRSKFLAAAVVVSAFALAPSLADARSHHRHYGYYHHDWYGLPYSISYMHNYGPGVTPSTFAYYDGPSTNYCYQGSATYIGQDRRRRPCF
jgi:hypothetical protein